MTENLAAFVEQVRARRAAAGQPDHIDDEALYRLLDGIVAERGTTPAGNRGRSNNTRSARTRRVVNAGA